MSKTYVISRNTTIMTLEIVDYRELPEQILEQLLGFSIGDSIMNNGILELELANDSNSDKEMNETLMEILQESGWKKC